MAPLSPTGLLSGAQQVSSLHVSSLPTIPSPTTPRRSSCLARFCNRTYRRGESQDPSHPLRQGIANVNWASPRTRRLAATTGRIEFVILRTDCSPSDALHLPSQGRSSGRLRDPSQAPTGTSTLLVRYTYDRTSPPASAGGFYLERRVTRGYRVGMARWAVVMPGVPRLPPGAFIVPCRPRPACIQKATMNCVWMAVPV